MTIKFQKIRPVKTPTFNKEDCGIDFYIPNDWNDGKTYTLNFGEDVCIPMGIRFELPEGIALLAGNKSGQSLKKKLVYGAGVIDASYTGEINLQLFRVCKGSCVIEPGEKIIQLYPIKQMVSEPEFKIEEVNTINKTSQRGSGGYGSTGTK